jgi:hypothetical protein
MSAMNGDGCCGRCCSCGLRKLDVILFVAGITIELVLVLLVLVFDVGDDCDCGGMYVTGTATGICSVCWCCRTTS